jgi:glutamine cyclotransferase
MEHIHIRKEIQETLMKKRHLSGILIATVVLVISFSILVLLNSRPVNTAPLRYTYDVVAVYPHDKNAFTQGLVIENGVLYESTGLYGNSTLRRVELETGKILQTYALPNQFFGEGITIFDDTIIQLTWQSHRGFVYDKHSFELLREFTYPTEGWGITNNGTTLIMSDGTATLDFLDPETFEKVGQIEVHDAGPVTNLNELEYIHGQVYANILGEEKIAVINPQTGQVNEWIDLKGINNQENQGTERVLNGIAYDIEGDRLFVTGKMWSQLFQIRLIALK